MALIAATQQVHYIVCTIQKLLQNLKHNNETTQPHCSQLFYDRQHCDQVERYQSGVENRPRGCPTRDRVDRPCTNTFVEIAASTVSKQSRMKAAYSIAVGPDNHSPGQPNDDPDSTPPLPVEEPIEAGPSLEASHSLQVPQLLQVPQTGGVPGETGTSTSEVLAQSPTQQVREGMEQEHHHVQQEQADFADVASHSSLHQTDDYLFVNPPLSSAADDMYTATLAGSTHSSSSEMQSQSGHSIDVHSHNQPGPMSTYNSSLGDSLDDLTLNSFACAPHEDSNSGRREFDTMNKDLQAREKTPSEDTSNTAPNTDHESTFRPTTANDQHPEMLADDIASVDSFANDDPSRHEEDDGKPIGRSKGHGSTSDYDATEGSTRERRNDSALNRETKRLRCSKGLVVIVLVLAACSSAYAVYYIGAQDEQRTYETRFRDIVTTIVAVSHLNAKVVFDTYDTVSHQITTYTSSSMYKSTHGEEKWPYVKIPGFEEQADQIRNATGTNIVGLSSVVRPDQLNDYNQWLQVNNAEWMQESLEHIGQPNLFIPTVPFVFVQDVGSEVPIKPWIPAPGSDEIAIVVSQIAPIAEAGAFVNYNSLDEGFARKTIELILQEKTMLLAEIRHDATTLTGDTPESYLAAPIFDSHAKETPEVVGILSGNILWEKFFVDLVPEGIDPIYLVVKNVCTLDYTFLIDGPRVEFVGRGDLHDTDIGSTTESSEFTPVPTFIGCSYTLHLYPTQDFYDTYHTRKPLVNTLTVVVTFLATAIVFVMYDVLVERRQNNVMRTADRSNAILRSLFPDNVRDRLLDMGDDHDHASRLQNVTDDAPLNDQDPVKTDALDEKEQRGRYMEMNRQPSVIGKFMQMSKYSRKGKSSHNRSLRQNSIDRANSMDPSGRLSRGSTHGSKHSNSVVYGGPSSSSGSIIRLKTKPIADLFPRATVLFADIVGFTAWSSTREPTQVFELLETLYNSFDAIARRLGVFKVETIGDCYVAATGLPEPNANHATVMIRFARACLSKMKQVMISLAVSLGPTTRKLAMRIGAHSGPVTAGVLRGEKSRFQLFGDTVNTASRMESCGASNRIHISQETADELVSSGRSSWLVARSDKVVAKGKGELQTYWIKTSSSPSQSQSQSSPDPSAAAAAAGTGEEGVTPSGDRPELGSVHSQYSIATAHNASIQDVTWNDGESEEQQYESEGIASDQLEADCEVQTSTSSSFGAEMEGESESDSESPQVMPLPSGTSGAQGKRGTRTTIANGHVVNGVDRPDGSNGNRFSFEHTKSERGGPATGRRPSYRRIQSISSLGHAAKLANLRPSVRIDTDTEFEIQWNVDVIQNMLKSILAVRDPKLYRAKRKSMDHHSSDSWASPGRPKDLQKEYSKIVLEEVKEVIRLPNKVPHTFQDPSSIEIPTVAKQEIRDYVETIAGWYRKNPFHSFSHATHVVQSTVKLMSRIIGSEAIDYNNMTYKKKSGKALHQNTYGITSDPLTQFACIVAALVHDVDHTGLPNSQLVKEGADIAQQYKNKSVAEQNSLNLAWDLLMEPRFENFRACIYCTQAELDRFRQLLVNAVMATDIMDKELGTLRRARWEKAFSHRLEQVGGSPNKMNDSNGASGDMVSGRNNAESVNRMATIVIEHLIQASDVSHTMQHWHIYTKWNELLFDEMYKAYLAGRATEDPTMSWYQGEIGFFDYYIIPLAKKLKDCGVFGVSSDEYLNYAQANRKEWETRGEELVKKYRSKFP